DQSAGEFAFQGLNFLGFSLAIVVQGQGEAVVLTGGDVAGGGLLGPVEDGPDGALLEANAGLAERVTQGCHSGAAELLGRGETAQQLPGHGTVPELVEAGGVAGQGGLEVLADL